MKKKHHRDGCRALYCVRAVAAAAAFAAGDSRAQVPPPGVDPTKIEEVRVTATKRDTTLQDADVSATVLSASALRDARVTDIRRIDDLAPSVQFNESSPLGAVFISIRGVESNPFIVNRAAVYIDGIPFRELSNSVLTQLDAVEILRGPQSTLYGANTESGLVLIRTRPPGEELEANITATATSFDTGEAYQLEGFIGGPIVDALQGSIAFRQSDRDYYMENIGATPQGPGTVDELFVQGRLRWTPNAAFTVNATSYMINTDAPGIYRFDAFPIEVDDYNAVYSEGRLFDPSNPLSTPPVNGSLRASDFRFVNDAPKRAEIRERVAGVSADYRLASGTINASISYRSEDLDDLGFDIDRSNGPFLAGASIDPKELWNAEVRWSSDDDEPLVYSVGASYYTETDTQRLGSLIGPGDLPDFVYSPKQSNESEDLGLFGSISYTPPAMPKLTATVGLRYDRAHRETSQQEGVLDLGFTQFVFDDLALEDTFEAWLPRFAIRYEASDSLTVYSNIARGYLPGGFNLAAAQDGFVDQVIEYDAESLWSFDLGARWRSSDGRIFLGAAVFYVETDNFQEISDLVDEQGNVASTSFIGADAATESYGLEIEGQWLATDRLSFTGNLGIIDASYTDFGGARREQIIGNPVKLIPEYDANLAVNYDHPTGLFVRGELTMLGETRLNEGPRPFQIGVDNRQKAVELFGVQVGYRTPRWSLRLFAENITDERRVSGLGFPNAVFPTDGVLYGSIDLPRVVGVELDLSY
ncbi:MAG: TonB-dependent receptor [Pseudomonadota bacterium]